MRLLAVDPGVSIELTQGFVAIIDKEDYELISQYKWRVQKRTHTSYAIRSWRDLKSGEVLSQGMHILIIGVSGVDHIDGNGLNNKRNNLRPATQSQNNYNRRIISGESRFKGVCRIKPGSTRWKASIRDTNGKKLYLGSFATEEEAALAYNEAAKIYAGEFAYLNEIT